MRSGMWFVVAFVVGLFGMVGNASGQCDYAWANSGAPGLDGTVETALVFDDGTGAALFAGGYFRFAGATEASLIAKWDGTEWLPVGGGLGDGTAGDRVSALVAWDFGDGPELVAAGLFGEADGSPVASMARWDGSGWSAMPTELDPFVGPTFSATRIDSMAVLDVGGGDVLHVGGIFSIAGGASNISVATWDGSAWSDMISATGPTPDNLSWAWAVFDAGSGPEVYMGGLFQVTADSTTIRTVARWDGTDWHPVGAPDTNARVRAMAIWDDGGGAKLYAAGGGLTGVNADHGLFRLDGSSWTLMGGGVSSGDAFGVAAFDDGVNDLLYLSGDFRETDPGNVRHPGVVGWDGTDWVDTGLPYEISNAEPDVRHLAVGDIGDGDRLFACGTLLTETGAFIETVGMYDGSAWSIPAAENVFDGAVRAFAEYDSGSGAELYAGGEFLNAVGDSATLIAKWTGSGWDAIATSFGDPSIGVFVPSVRAMEVWDDGGGAKLYVGGAFSSIDGVSANGMAIWDGTSWSAMSGFDRGEVNAIEAFDDGSGEQLYVTGRTIQILGNGFTTPLVRWNGTTWSSPSEQFETNARINDLETWDDGSGEQLYAIGALDLVGEDLGAVARWDGTDWERIEYGTTVRARQLAGLSRLDDGSGEKLYGVGAFDRIEPSEGFDYGGLAYWDGSDWVRIGGQLQTPGAYLEIAHGVTVLDDGSGPALCCVGHLGWFGGGAQTHVYRWDGTEWVMFSTGFTLPFEDNPVESVAMRTFDDGSGEQVFFAGDFTTVDDRPSWYMVRWAPATAQFSALLHDRAVDPGESVSFDVSPSSPTGVTYQWRKGGAPLSDGGRFSGVTTSSLGIAATELADTAKYDVLVTNACGASTSRAASLIVVPPACGCVGNLDATCGTDVLDFGVFVSNFGSSVIAFTNGDFDGDGVVTVLDFGIFAGDFGCVE